MDRIEGAARTAGGPVVDSVLRASHGLQSNYAALHSLASQLYTQGSLSSRVFQQLRALICPFDLLLSHVPAGSRVLDIGCGSGLFLGILAAIDSSASGIGCDANGRSIALANAMTERWGFDSRLRFVCLNLRNRLPMDVFDVVVAIDVLHHLSPSIREATVKEAAGRIRPGGVFIYKDMRAVPFWRATANRVHDLVVRGELIRHVALVEVERWFKQLGFSAQYREAVPRLWYAHELVAFRAPPLRVA